MSNEFIVKNGLIVGGNVVTSGTITINGALAATQSWVTSQGYLTSASLSGYATQSYVTSAIAALVDSAPAALDTLNELAAALGDDANFSTTITNSIASKQSQLNGTGLVRMSGTSVSYDNTTYLISNFGNIEGDHTYGYPSSDGWYKIAEVVLTSTCQSFNLWGEYRDTGYFDNSHYRIHITARAECDFPTNNENHAINVNIYGSSTNDTYFSNNVRVVLTQSSSNYRKYELQYYRSTWDTGSWRLQTLGWTTYTTSQTAGTPTGTPRVYYVSKFSTDNIFVANRLSIGTTYAGFAANIAGTTYIIGASVWVNDGYGLTNASSGGTGFFPYSDGTLVFNSANSEKMRVASSGNVGIGTNSPGYKLEVNGGATGNNIARFTTGGAGGGTRGLTMYSDNSQVKLQVSDNAGGVGTWAFLNLNPDGGNVGIGTTNPIYKLHVVGDLYVNGTNGAFTTDNSQSNLYFLNLTRSTTSLVTAGNVGIKVANPTATLSLGTSSYDNNPLAGLEYSQVTGGGRLDLKVQTWGTGSDYALTTGLTVLTPGFNTNNVRVGIGTSSPATPLHVTGGGTGTGGWNRTATLAATYPGLIFNSNGTKWGGMAYDYSAAMRFWVNANNDDIFAGTLALSILNNGNVGIGDTTPATKLVVDGVISATGGNSTNWNTAYGWGNHASAGYLTSVSDIWVNTAGDTMTGSLLFADVADNVRLQKGSSFLNLRDPWNNTHLSNGIGGGHYFDASHFYLRSTGGGTTWLYLDGSNFNVSVEQNNYSRVYFRYNADRYSQTWYNSTTGAYWWVTTDADKLGFHRNGDGDKFYFSNAGDFYSTTNGWLSTALAAKQNASTAITTSNIASQSVSYANSAGEAGQVTNQSGQLLRYDNRTISPSETTAGYLQFGFTSWGNDNSSPYADYLHMRSYTDGSGGNDNLVMFLKSGIGMRIYQQTFGSGSAYSSYADVWHTGNLTNLNQLSNGPGYITSYSETDTLASVTGRGASTTSAITVRGITATKDTNQITINRVDGGGATWQFYSWPGGLNIFPNSQLPIFIGRDGSVTDFSLWNGKLLFENKNAIEGNADSWLRLNNSNHYTSGVYTPYNLRNDGAFDNYGGIYGYNTIRARKLQTVNNYTTAALWTESYDLTTTGIAFHISGIAGKFLEMRTDGILYWENNKVWTAGNDGSGSGLDADLLDGQNSTEFLRLLSGGAEASLDSYTDNGFRSVSFAGHSQHLLSWNAGGSTGTVQQLFHYGVPNNGWRIRNKTDNSSWSDWGYVVMASSNQGLISGTIATQSWVGSQSYATTSYVTTQINNLIAGAPGALDTLDELAAALGDDSNFATTVTNSIAAKLPLAGGNMTGSIGMGAGADIAFTGGSHGIYGNNTGYLHFYNYTDVYFNNQLVIRGGIRNDNGNVLIDDNLNLSGELAFPDGGGAYSNIIRAAAYPTEGFPTGSNYWMEYRAKGGHHFILNTDGGVGGGANTMDDFVVWQGAIDGNRLLEVSNTGNLWIAGALTEASSIKLKENVETSEGNLEKVVNLRPVTYNKIGSQTKELGLIAEEVATVYPEFVQYDESGEPVGVNYSRLTAALIGAVKELSSEVKELKKQING
jgi:hypothetical protein